MASSSSAETSASARSRYIASVRTSYTPVGSKAGSRMSVACSPSHDDIRARACHNGFQLVLLGLRDPERIQRVLQVV
jgi:hypothetical protein